MSELAPQLLALAALAVLAAGLFRGFAGFGQGLMASPVLGTLLGPARAVPVINLLALLAGLQQIRWALRHARKRVAGPLVLGSMLGLPLGIWMLEEVDATSLVHIIACVVLFAVAILATGVKIKGLDRALPCGLVGIASGALMGMGGVGGPPLILVMLASDSSPENSRADLICVLTAQCAVLFGLYIWRGFLSLEVVLLALAAAPILMFGIWAGGRIFGGKAKESYRKVALVFLVIVALATLLR